jgi:tetratricopeptide (TPR) repeat protein
LHIVVRFEPIDEPQKIAVRQIARRDGGGAFGMWPNTFSHIASKKCIHRNPRLPHPARMRWLLILQMCCLLATFRADAQTTNSTSLLIEAAGQVEFLTVAATNWQPAAVGLALLPGDRVRTHAQSRAAVQLSDRSVIRLDELTTLEILPPRNAEKKRFGLPHGAIYFFNREKPADVEFDTPLAAGAIRGTEFLLAVAADSTVNLALIDGLVSLQTTNHGEINLQRGEDLELTPGQPPVKTALVNVPAKIQWALYYPAVVDPGELQFTTNEQVELAVVLKKYREGDLLGALAAWPVASTNGSAGQKILRAQLELAVGGVSEAGQLLAGLPGNPASALRELISVVRGGQTGELATTQSASRLLADSYALQASTDLEAARTAARRAVACVPDFGFAHARLAELEWCFGNRRAALAELKLTYDFSPRLASACALQGFILLDQGEPGIALVHFDHARELDAALGQAWLGRGLCLMQQRKFTGARAAFQAAAALEPQRSLFRSYLGKAAGELGDTKSAAKEFRLAKELDPNDPTPWLYSALELWQENNINAAIRDLETSYDKNDNQAVFRSRELLDSDRSVRSADLAAIYDDAGLSEVSRHLAQRSVSESYANFSGHLFLADSYQSQEQANSLDLRLETARQSELLVANLLAPPGAGNLSQVLSESDRVRFFGQKPIGVSSLTGYDSRGDWSETATVFGSADGFSYAFDTVYQSLNGQGPNSDYMQRDFVLTMKQRITPDDDAYFQIGAFHANAGDITTLYDPATATPGLHTDENQLPDVYAGWHHTWSPGIHTLALVSRLNDKATLHDPQSDQIFLFQSGGVTQSVLSPPPGPPLTNDLTRQFTLYSAELQQIFETVHHSLVIGGRWQSGDVNSRADLGGALGPVTTQSESGDMSRGSAYGYYTWRPVEPLSLIGGVTYDHLSFPADTSFTPVSFQETSRDQWSPKAGILFTPWDRGLLSASYTRSLGGLFFDNSIRLEPTQVGGFNQAFRSLIPESVAGLVPGASFETKEVGFDQSFAAGTFFGAEYGWLTSDGNRTVGVLTNSTFLPAPDSPGTTAEKLDFREQYVSAYAAQLMGDYFSTSARYRWNDARLTEKFPQIPNSASGLSQLEQNNTAVLNQVSLQLNFNHPCGVFAQWDSSWYQQDNSGYTPSLAGADFWQHNVMIGYRFAHRHAEIRAAILNLTDTDYRLNPLNLYGDLPRGRTFAFSLRLNF